jgi:hypothetical protein
MTLFPLASSSPPNLPSFPSLQILADSKLRIPALAAFFQHAGFVLLPALALSTLFFSSTLYTEAITRKKYQAAYAAYQKRVGMFLPVKAVITALFADNDTDRLIWGEFYNSKTSKSD